jgi:hypothetical protein
VYRSLAGLLRARRGNAAFHPGGCQRVPPFGPGVFAVERISPGGDRSVLSLVNVTPGAVGAEIGTPWKRDILTGKSVSRDVRMRPYEVLWLES